MPLEAPVTRASFRASITGGNYPASGFPNQPGDAPFWHARIRSPPAG